MSRRAGNVCKNLDLDSFPCKLLILSEGVALDNPLNMPRSVDTYRSSRKSTDESSRLKQVLDAGACVGSCISTHISAGVDTLDPSRIHSELAEKGKRQDLHTQSLRGACQGNSCG